MYRLRRCLWPEEQENLEAEMKKIESQQSVDGSQSTVDAFSSVMGPEQPGRLILYGRGLQRLH